MTNFLYIIAFFSLVICILYNLSVRYNNYNQLLNNNNINQSPIKNGDDLNAYICKMNKKNMTKQIDRESDLELQKKRKEEWKKNIKMKLLNSCYGDSENDDLNKSLVSKNMFVHP